MLAATGSLRCTADIQAVDATDSRGSASDSRVSDLTAGKLTPKLSVRIADVHGRQLPTHSRRWATRNAGGEADAGERSPTIIRPGGLGGCAAGAAARGGLSCAVASPPRCRSSGGRATNPSSI